MEKTTRSLIALLETPDMHLRIAAMRVVAALELGGKPVVRALAASLDAEDEAVQVQALRGLAQLGPSDALDLVAPKLLESGVVRQQASQVLALAGASAVPVLRKLLPKADMNGRRAIATTLAAIGGVPAFALLLRTTVGEDLEMIKHTTGCARQILEKLPSTGRAAAAREIRSFLRDRKTSQNPHALIAGLILLGGMSDPKAADEARTLLLHYLDRKMPEPVRRNAAVSLARLPVPEKRVATLLPKLLPLLQEPEWSPVVQSALSMVQRLELQPSAVLGLLPLLRRSPHVAVQAHVVERLRGIDRPTVVSSIVPHLASPHPRLREAAEATLKSMPSAAPALLETWLAANDPDLGRRIELILRAHPEAVRKRVAARAAEQVLTLQEKDDARWETFYEFVRSNDLGVLQTRAAARLKAQRASKSARNRQATERLLRWLWDQGLANGAQRYEYALLLLGHDRKDVGREARDADPALRVLSGLARQDGARLVKSLVGERSLGAEEYFYIGFHWSEAGDEMRPFGRSLLEHVVRQYPRHKLRRAAERKLELQAVPAAHVADP
jgi:HEAT repeat protein